MRRLILLCLLLVSCSSPKPEEQSGGVLVSIPPFAYFAKNLVGEEITVTTLLPQGSDPHTYEPRPSQAVQAEQATVWFRMGEPFELQIKRAVEGNKRLQIVDLREGLALLPGACHCKGCHHCHEGQGDPHVWLSPRLAQDIVHRMAQVLATAYPDQAGAIAQRERLLLADLVQLDAQLTRELAPAQGRSYLVSHPSFAYLFRDYDLHQLSIEQEGKEPTARQLAAVIDEAKSSGVDRILVQEQFSDRGAKAVAKELDLPTYPVDPLAEDYPRNLRYIAAILVEPPKHD